MKIEEIIDRAKIAANIESDMQLSKHLGLSKSAVANWRAGTSYPNTVSCERLAGLTGIPLVKVIGIVGEARAISREEKAVWRKLAAIAALLILTTWVTYAPQAMARVSAHRVIEQARQHFAENGPECILCHNWLRPNLAIAADVGLESGQQVDIAIQLEIGLYPGVVTSCCRTDERVLRGSRCTRR